MVALNLTPKQTTYADAILDGKTGSDAYRCAYNTKGGNRVVARKAADLKKHPAVQGYIRKVRAESQARKILERQQALGVLSDIVMNEALAAKDRIKAIETLSKLQGWNVLQKPKEQETGSLLRRIRQGRRTTANPTT